MPPMPPPPSGHRPLGQPKTLVGGLPWEKPAAQPAGPEPVPGMPVVGDSPPAPKPGVSIGSVQPPPTEPEPLTPRQRLEAWIRKSPPFSVSLSLHVVALIVLALIFYPREDDRAIKLDLAWASDEVVEDDDKGVQIVAAEDPMEEPEPEVVATEEPVVEDPVAAPVMTEEPVEVGVGAVAEAVPQNVPIGSLLDGRQEGRREALVKAFGGSDATEAAVAKALAWLAKQQGKDGLWSLQGPYADGGSQENQLAATAMALLAFQGAGNTPTTGRHKETVARGWKGLLAKQLPDGTFDIRLPSHHAFYSHAQATYALCELVGMTDGKLHVDQARRALDYALAAQAPNGGWRYAPREPGDMSVTGWFMMALKSGEMAGLSVPGAALDGVSRFLDTVAVDGGSRYGYRLDSPQRPPTGVTPAVTAEGLLARQFLGWGRTDRRITAGLEHAMGERFLDFENDKDVYAWYYITQVVHNVGGSAWERWNGRMREVVPAAQVEKGPEAGSWDPALDKWGHIGGRLFTTCFLTYMLEVYYRHLPIYGAVLAGD
jgi:hypothetical protein